MSKINDQESTTSEDVRALKVIKLHKIIEDLICLQEDFLNENGFTSERLDETIRIVLEKILSI